jgi:hypothetical protein
MDLAEIPVVAMVEVAIVSSKKDQRYLPAGDRTASAP